MPEPIVFRAHERPDVEVLWGGRVVPGRDADAAVGLRQRLKLPSANERPPR